MWMEIGFGYGEHLVQWMMQYPKRSMIGVEVFENGWVSCVNQLPDHGMDAFALFNEPVEELLPTLPDSVLSGIIIRFPDPWPKRRHEKRRLIQPDFLNECSRVVKNKGTLYFASDHTQMVDFAHMAFVTHPRWHCAMHGTIRPAGWPVSRYESKAMAKRIPCMYTVCYNRG
jgi:tRNA (guanine-N7-)-methyltransferase